MRMMSKMARIVIYATADYENLAIGVKGDALFAHADVAGLHYSKFVKMIDGRAPSSTAGWKKMLNENRLTADEIDELVVMRESE